jgi:hypothetical protein
MAFYHATDTAGAVADLGKLMRVCEAILIKYLRHGAWPHEHDDDSIRAVLLASSRMTTWPHCVGAS